DFERPHARFVDLMSWAGEGKTIISDFATIERRVVLASTERWKPDLGECFERHAGSYLMHSCALSDPRVGAISLLRIKEKTERGILFDLHNVDTREPDTKRYYYAGLMFPVGNNLTFYGEERSLLEPLSMVTTSAQVPRSSVLWGHFVAITDFL